MQAVVHGENVAEEEPEVEALKKEVEKLLKSIHRLELKMREHFGSEYPDAGEFNEGLSHNCLPHQGYQI